MSDVKLIIEEIEDALNANPERYLSTLHDFHALCSTGRIRALIDHVKAVDAERDGWRRIVVEIASAAPIPSAVKATGSTKDLIEYFKSAERERDEQSSRIADLERQLAEARNAVDAYDEGMAHIGSCGDGGCLIMKPEGMHTNGGCRCSTDKYKAQRAMQRGRMLAATIRAMKQEAGE